VVIKTYFVENLQLLISHNACDYGKIVPMVEKDNRKLSSSLVWFLLTLIAIVALSAIGPAEKSLGTNVRVVYLHGAWVWTALAAYIAAGITGFLGLVLGRQVLQLWSRALGRTGLLFWLTYLPLSMWAMQANWNGLFLAEPRFKFAIVFSVTGILLQIGVTLMENPAWASGANMMFVVALFLALSSTENVMHPPSAILDSEAIRIQLYFGGLILLVLLAAYQIARRLYKVDRRSLELSEDRELESVRS
jgi:hypothetical protein